MRFCAFCAQEVGTGLTTCPYCGKGLPVSKKQGAPKEEAPKEEAPREEAPKEEAPKEEAPKEEAPKEVAPKEVAPSYQNGPPQAPNVGTSKPPEPVSAPPAGPDLSPAPPNPGSAPGHADHTPLAPLPKSILGTPLYVFQIWSGQRQRRNEIKTLNKQLGGISAQLEQSFCDLGQAGITHLEQSPNAPKELSRLHTLRQQREQCGADHQGVSAELQETAATFDIAHQAGKIELAERKERIRLTTESLNAAQASQQDHRSRLSELERTIRQNTKEISAKQSQAEKTDDIATREVMIRRAAELDVEVETLEEEAALVRKTLDDLEQPLAELRAHLQEENALFTEQRKRHDEAAQAMAQTRQTLEAQIKAGSKQQAHLDQEIQHALAALGQHVDRHRLAYPDLDHHYQELNKLRESTDLVVQRIGNLEQEIARFDTATRRRGLILMGTTALGALALITWALSL